MEIDRRHESNEEDTEQDHDDTSLLFMRMRIELTYLIVPIPNYCTEYTWPGLHTSDI